jgi:D-alanine transaminase
MIVYLNGKYLPAEEARISPLDRGFLFGDGIYEVTPSYDGRTVALGLHIQRLTNGLAAIGMDNPLPAEEWDDMARQLGMRNGGGNLGIYFHVSRGFESRRFHGFPQQVAHTVFGMVIDIDPHPLIPDRNTERGLRVQSSEDLRWRRCNIKSTSLLGNVLHYQESYSSGNDETIMYNSHGELTEASASNVFIVKDGVVATPLLDQQKLPGISRHITLASLRAEGSIPVREGVVTMDQVRDADEIWLTNSSKHIGSVVELDGKPVADGSVGPVWEKAMKIYEAAKYDY